MNVIDFSSIGCVGVLFGGLSAEREISLESGQVILSALKNIGVNAVAVDIKESKKNRIVECIISANIDFAFIALHGGFGEDGRIQALLDLMNIPYTGSDTQASVLSMNKQISKQLWQGIGLPTPTFAILDEATDFHKVIRSLGGSAIVKPANEGSSIGMSLVYSEKELFAAYQRACAYDKLVIAETLVTGGEYTVAILNDKILPVMKVETTHDFYDYDAKYISNNTCYLYPCGLNQEKEQELKRLALRAFHSLHCRGWGRVDIMVDKSKKFHLLEVNTVPGMTSHSVLPIAAKAAGYCFEDIVADVLCAAIHKNNVYRHCNGKS